MADEKDQPLTGIHRILNFLFFPMAILGLLFMLPSSLVRAHARRKMGKIGSEIKDYYAGKGDGD